MKHNSLLSLARKCMFILACLFIFSCSNNKQMSSYKRSTKRKTHYKKSPRQVASKQRPPQRVERTQENNEFPEYHYENCNAALSYMVGRRGVRKESMQIRIDKSEYKLSVYGQGELLKEYPVVFGKNPRGDKLMQGDKRTPEGEFKVRAYYPHNTWEKFIWIDYPTEQSYMKHQAAKRRGLIPATASIGGEIGIHGVPDNKNYAITERQNWTLGCIAMKNQDLNELYAYISKNMLITIED